MTDDQTPPPLPLEPLTDDERARLREAGFSDEEIERLDRVRLTAPLGELLERVTRLP